MPTPSWIVSRRGVFGIVGLGAAATAGGLSLASCGTSTGAAAVSATPTPSAPSSTPAPPSKTLPAGPTYEMAADQVAIAKDLDAMTDLTEFGAAPLLHRVFWALWVMADLDKTGHYGPGFSAVAVLPTPGTDAIALGDGSPWQTPYSYRCDPELIHLATTYEWSLIIGAGKDGTEGYGRQPMDKLRAGKFLLSFVIDRTGPFYGLVNDEIAKAVTVEGLEDAMISRKPTADTITKYTPPGSSESMVARQVNYGTTITYTFAFLELGAILGQNQVGDPAGIWLYTGEF